MFIHLKDSDVIKTKDKMVSILLVSVQFRDLFSLAAVFFTVFPKAITLRLKSAYNCMSVSECIIYKGTSVSTI